MADETTHTVTIEHNLEDYSKLLWHINMLWSQHNTRVKAANEEFSKFNTKMRGGDTSTATGSGGGSRQDQNLDREYKRAMIPYARASMPLLRATYGLTAGATRGAYSMATGGGLSGLYSGITTELKRAFSPGFAGNILGGAAIGAATRRAGGAAAAVEAEEMEGAIAKGAETGIGMGLVQAFGKLPGIMKLGVTALLAAGGLDVMLMEKAAKDVYGRSRRALGYGANLGQLTAFDTTMGRFVDTSSTMANIAQGKYDITSPQYVALRLAGINPREWKDPAAMAEGTILGVQRQLKQFSPETMLPMAHARGFGDLFSDEELIRLYNANQDEVNSMVKLAQSHAKGLDISEDEQKAFKDLSTNIDLAGNELKTLGEHLMSKQIPAFEELTKKIMDLVQGLGGTEEGGPEGGPGTIGGKTSAVGGGGVGIGGPEAAATGARKLSRSGGAESIGPIDLGDKETKVGSYEDAMRVMMAAGASPKLAAGLAGEFTAETRLGTMFGGKVLGVGTGDSGAASGMAQWHSDRWNPLVAWAKSQGLDPSKPSTQYKMAVHEAMEPKWATMRARIESAEGAEAIERAADAFEGNLTGPGRPSAVSGTARALDALKKMATSPVVSDTVKKDSDTTKAAIQKAAAAAPKKPPMVNFGSLDDAEKAKEARDRAAAVGVGATGPQSMNDKSLYQMDRGMQVKVSNPAGANVNVQTAMLGALQGEFA